MLVFISYPHETEIFAVGLEAQLASYNIDTFLDKENIDFGDAWKREIDLKIMNADVFIVLYLPEADTKERVFRSELELIEDACRQRTSTWLPKWLQSEPKRLMTVIFPPTTHGDVRPYFAAHHLVLTDVPGRCADKRNAYWIDQIVERIERIRRVKSFKWRQIAARTALTAGLIIVVTLSYYLSYYQAKLDERNAEIKLLKSLVQLDGAAVCESLMGEYGLYQKYVFLESQDVRSVSTKAKWSAADCKYDQKHNAYVLRGEEKTDFDVEMIINNKYERIARAVYQYKSQVLIGKDGTLLGRSFEAVLTPTEVIYFQQDADGNDLPVSDEIITKKFKLVTQLRDDRHHNLTTDPCIPAIGKTGGRTSIAFVCRGYTRTMVKIS
jgi:hypothetical protein